ERPYPVLSVRYRAGGERICPHDGSRTRELRTLLQEHGIPPWLRDRIPLVYEGERLIAAADLFTSAPARELGDRLQARIVWETARRPSLAAGAFPPRRQPRRIPRRALLAPAAPLRYFRAMPQTTDPNAPTPDTASTEPSRVAEFERSLDELEQIVQRMEHG